MLVGLCHHSFLGNPTHLWFPRTESSQYWLQPGNHRQNLHSVLDECDESSTLWVTNNTNSASFCQMIFFLPKTRTYLLGLIQCLLKPVGSCQSQCPPRRYPNSSGPMASDPWPLDLATCSSWPHPSDLTGRTGPVERGCRSNPKVNYLGNLVW